MSTHDTDPPGQLPFNRDIDIARGATDAMIRLHTKHGHLEDNLANAMTAWSQMRDAAQALKMDELGALAEDMADQCQRARYDHETRKDDEPLE